MTAPCRLVSAFVTGWPIPKSLIYNKCDGVTAPDPWTPRSLPIPDGGKTKNFHLSHLSWNWRICIATCCRLNYCPSCRPRHFSDLPRISRGVYPRGGISFPEAEANFDLFRAVSTCFDQKINPKEKIAPFLDVFVTFRSKSLFGCGFRRRSNGQVRNPATCCRCVAFHVASQVIDYQDLLPCCLFWTQNAPAPLDQPQRIGREGAIRAGSRGHTLPSCFSFSKVRPTTSRGFLLDSCSTTYQRVPPRVSQYSNTAGQSILSSVMMDSGLPPWGLT